MSAENEFFRVIKTTEDVSYVLEIKNEREVRPHMGAKITATTEDSVVVEVKDKAHLTIGGYGYIWDASTETLIPLC